VPTEELRTQVAGWRRHFSVPAARIHLPASELEKGIGCAYRGRTSRMSRGQARLSAVRRQGKSECAPPHWLNPVFGIIVYPGAAGDPDSIEQVSLLTIGTEVAILG
jgi:hypothetical protein